MDKRSLAVLLAAAAAIGPAYGITGNTVVYDDADENAFNRFAAACGSSSFAYDETGVVHGGSHSIALSRLDDNGIGWAGPATYSTTTDYDGVVFWINAGNSATSLTTLAVQDHAGGSHFLHLEDVYGGPLPAGTWIRFAIPFSSTHFNINGGSPPDNFDQFCVINHSAGTQTTFIYIDDVTLTGADIFKNSFELVPP